MLGVVVALNIVVAFVLDAYSAIEESAQQEQRQAEHGDGPTAWVDDHLLLDAGRVTGTSTGLTGEIEVSLDPSLSVSLTESRRAMLSALFAHRTADGLEAVAPVARQLPPKQQLARGASWKQQLAQTFASQALSLKAAERDDKQGGKQGDARGRRGGPSYTPPEPAAAPAAPRRASLGEVVLGFAQAAAGATALAAVGTEHEVAADLADT